MIEIGPDSYVHTVWMIGCTNDELLLSSGHANADILCVLYRKKQEDPWSLFSRLRYELRDGKDERRPIEATFRGEISPDEAYALAQGMVRHMEGFFRGVCETEQVPVHGGPEEFANAMSRQPWVKTRNAAPEEEAERKRKHMEVSDAS